jgi:hypothetical protein
VNEEETYGIKIMRYLLGWKPVVEGGEKSIWE